MSDMFTCENFPSRRWADRGATLCAGAMVAVMAWASIVAMSQPAIGQGFYFGPGYGVGYGPGYGAGRSWQPDALGSGYLGGGFRGGGFGVAPSRIDLSIGVPPSFPYPIGVRPGYFIPPPIARYGYDPTFGGYPDYRSQYTLRVLRAHQAQLGYAEAIGLTSRIGGNLGVNPLYQDEMDQRFSRGGSMLGDRREYSRATLKSELDTQWPTVTAEGISAITDQLIQAARRLDQALAGRGKQVDIWREYLSTELIVAVDRQPLTESQWTSVLRNFDGVVANGDLRWVMRSDGFAETRQWAGELVNAMAAFENRTDHVDDEESSPLAAPNSVPPPALSPTPVPGSKQEQGQEVLPAPQRARL